MAEFDDELEHARVARLEANARRLADLWEDPVALAEQLLHLVRGLVRSGEGSP